MAYDYKVGEIVTPISALFTHTKQAVVFGVIYGHRYRIIDISTTGISGCGLMLETMDGSPIQRGSFSDHWHPKYFVRVNAINRAFTLDSI